MATTYYNDLQKLYVAYFNRPADTAGLNYYEGVLEGAKGDAKAVAATMAAISASFAASAEYKAAYANMSNADVVNAVYQNLFGRPAEDAGKAYWAGLLDAKKITIDAVVTQVAGGAQGSDLTAYNNKVAASLAFTNALGTTNAYSGDQANAAAKAFLSGVTDNASYANATDPVILGTTVAKVNIAGTPFTLQSALDNKAAADLNMANFLAAADGDNDPKTSTTPDAIGANVNTKIAAVDGAVAGDYTNATAGVRAALLADQQAANANGVTTAQTAVTSANAKVAAVAGLNDAVTALTTATTAAASAKTAATSAATDVALKLAAYNVLNKSAVAVPAAGTYTLDTLIVNDKDKGLILATGVTETTNPGVTALLNSLIAEKSADTSAKATADAQVAAQANVDFLDLTDAAKADLTSIATSMKLATGVLPTAAQITAQQKGLDATVTSAKAVSDAYPTDANLKATADAQAASDAFKALVTKLYADDTSNPLLAAQKTANDNLTAANKVVTDLNKALTDLSKAVVVKAELDAVKGQVDAANNVFTANKLGMPEDLSTDKIATVGSDIYIAKTTNATITNFGILGSDALYVGSKYTLNTTGDITKGVDTALEAFIIKSGSDTKIVLEQKAFASSELTPGADLVTITLTGVDSTKVHLNNGIITVS